MPTVTMSVLLTLLECRTVTMSVLLTHLECPTVTVTMSGVVDSFRMPHSDYVGVGHSFRMPHCDYVGHSFRMPTVTMSVLLTLLERPLSLCRCC